LGAAPKEEPDRLLKELKAGLGSSAEATAGIRSEARSKQPRPKNSEVERHPQLLKAPASYPWRFTNNF